MSAILFALLKGSVYTLQPSTIQGNNWGGEQPLNWRVYQQSHHSVLNTMSAILFALLKGSVYTLQPSTIQAITNQENEVKCSMSYQVKSSMISHHLHGFVNLKNAKRAKLIMFPMPVATSHKLCVPISYRAHIFILIKQTRTKA
jgi:hypothetical protein